MKDLRIQALMTGAPPQQQPNARQKVTLSAEIEFKGIESCRLMMQESTTKFVAGFSDWNGNLDFRGWLHPMAWEKHDLAESRSLNVGIKLGVETHLRLRNSRLQNILLLVHFYPIISSCRLSNRKKMRFFSILSSLALLGAATAQSASPTPSGSPSSCTPGNADNQVVQFAWYLQFFIDRFYGSVALNQTILSGLPESSSVNYADNLRGLQQKNRLGVRAIQQLGAKVPGFTTPQCNFSLPSIQNGRTYLSQAARFESDVSGAFIGLAGYSQKPEITFLMARLAAEHGAHSAYLGSHLAPVYFEANHTALIPAYSPGHVVKAGYQPGMLGRYLHGCAREPAGPCGQQLLIGTLGANLTSPSVSSSLVMASSSSLGLSSASSTPASLIASATPGF